MKDYICLEKILENYPECMIDRHQFVAVLSDFFPKDQITKNLILSVYDSDICVELATFGDISRANIDRYIRILKDNYKIESKQARKALNIWIDALNLMPANKRESIINTLYYCNTADNFHYYHYYSYFHYGQYCPC